MPNRKTISDIVRVLEAYFEGLYYADSKILATAFHQDAKYINTVNGDYMNYSMPEYFEIVDKRTPPSIQNEIRNESIISIECTELTMAFAKVSMTMLGKEYLDYLTLIDHNNSWQIISKVFSYTKIKEKL